VALHYETQIQVLAKMCFGNNVACVQKLQQVFSFELVFAAIENKKLPNSTRAAFVELMIHLYVAVEPHERLRLPNLIRLYGDLRNDVILGDGTETALPHAPKVLIKRLRLLKFFTSDYLSSAGAEIHNMRDIQTQHFILALIKMCQFIAQYGFYSNAGDIQIFLCNPLLHALDGRLDIFEEVHDCLHARKSPGDGNNNNQGLSPDEHLSPLDRYRSMPSTELAMRIKTEVCTALLIVAGIRIDYRSSKMLHGFHFLAEKDTIKPKKRRSLISFRKISRTANVRTKRIFPVELSPDGTTAETFDDVNPSPPESQLRALLSWIDCAEYTPTIERDSERLFDDLFVELFHNSGNDPNRTTLDFELMTDAPFITICIDLLMYESPQLFGVAISLLVRKFTTKAKLRQQLSQMQLLARKEVLLNYEQIRDMLTRIESATNAFPVWAMGNFPGQSLNEQEKRRSEYRDAVIKVIQKLGTMAHQPPVSVHQDLLRRAGACEIVLAMLRVRRRTPTAEHTEQRRRRIVEHNQILDEVSICCHKLLAAFAEGHPCNQALLYKQVEGFVGVIHQLPQDSMVYVVLCTMRNIFEGNERLLQKVPPKFVQVLLQSMLSKRGTDQHFAHATKFTSFFLCMCEVNGHAVPSNQLLLINTLALEGPLISAIKDHSRRTSLMCSSADEMDTATATDTVESVYKPEMTSTILNELCFHLQLLQLVVAISRQSTERVHAKMRGVWTFHDLLDVISEEARTMHPNVFQLLCEYLTEAFFLSKLKLADTAEGEGSDVCNKMLAAWVCMLQRFNSTYAADKATLSAAAVAHQRCLVCGVFPCLTAYIRRIGSERAKMVLSSNFCFAGKSISPTTLDGMSNSGLVEELLAGISQFEQLEFERESATCDADGVGCWLALQKVVVLRVFTRR
jgi:hypothetical protein